MSHMYKRIFKFELQLSSYWQNIKFSRYCPKFHIFTKIIIFQVYLQLFRPTASCKFYDRDMSGILFFIFASCEPLKHCMLECRQKSVKQFLPLFYHRHLFIYKTNHTLDMNCQSQTEIQNKCQCNLWGYHIRQSSVSSTMDVR